MEPLSLDEAFLDISGTRRLLGPPDEVAAWLRRRVHDEERLSCSVGVASNKFLAKLATNQAKPRASRSGPVEGPGVHVIPPGGELDFLHPLAVGELWGVGPATLAKLERLGIATVGDLAEAPFAALVTSLGRGAATHLHDLAHGRDERAVVPDSEPKSISHEETFATDLTSLDQLRPEVVRMCDAVAARLRHHGYRGRTVQLKVRYRDFTTVTRSTTLGVPTDRGTDVLDTAWSMLALLPVPRGVRLVGVGMSNLGHEAAQEQLSLDLGVGSGAPGGAAAGRVDPGDWDAANRAVDAIRDRFGAQLVRPARLAGRTERPGSSPWGPSSDAGPEPVPGPDGGPASENPSGDRAGRGSRR